MKERLPAGSRELSCRRSRAVLVVELSVEKDPTREHQVECSWQVRCEPAGLAIDGHAEQQSGEHGQEVERAEYKKEESSTAIGPRLALRELPRGARKPADDEKLRQEESRIRKSAALP